MIIDPKGVIGEPAYEVAAFIRNPIPELLALPNVKAVISHRISTFARFFALDERRIAQWCFVQAVLAHVWTIEDNSGDPRYFMNLTEIFDALHV